MPNQSEMEARLAGAQIIREKIDAFNDLAWELRNLEPERVLELAREAYEMSTSGEFAAQPYHKGQAASLVARAQIHRQ